LNLERVINNLEKRVNRFDSAIYSSNKTGLSIWKGKPIIPLDDWIGIRDTPHALYFFPDDFDQTLKHIPEDEVGPPGEREEVRKWDSDYLELMEYTKNPNYGRFRCFHCLLSPDGDDPIFIGFNRLVAKGLTNDEQGKEPIQYSCNVVNRFQCPYECTSIKDDDANFTNSTFDVEDLFRLQRMAFVVELALAKARKDNSQIQIKDKQDLLNALTNNETFTKILHQADDTLRGIDYPDVSSVPDNDFIADYFIRIENKIDLEELRFY
jgi:hypothetical protein